MRAVIAKWNPNIQQYEKEEKQFRIGAILTGIRLSDITFESREEIMELIAHPEYLTMVFNAMLSMEQQIDKGLASGKRQF